MSYTCTRCAGKGKLDCFSNVLGGVCFKCKGTGKQEAKPAKASVMFKVYGHDRVTGEAAHLYNRKAKNEKAALQSAYNVYGNASQAFKEQYSLANGFAVAS